MLDCGIKKQVSSGAIKPLAIRKCSLYFFYFYILTQGQFFIAFREREEGRERNISVGEKHGWVASPTRPDQVCALTGSRTHNQPGHSGQGMEVLSILMQNLSPYSLLTKSFAFCDYTGHISLSITK